MDRVYLDLIGFFHNHKRFMHYSEQGSIDFIKLPKGSMAQKSLNTLTGLCFHAYTLQFSSTLLEHVFLKHKYLSTMLKILKWSQLLPG